MDCCNAVDFLTMRNFGKATISTTQVGVSPMLCFITPYKESAVFYI